MPLTHPWRFLLACCLLVGALAAVGDASPAFAAAPSLTVNHTKAMPGERLSATGKVATRFRRPVQLQYRSGTAWRTTVKGTTTTTGTYRLGGFSSSTTRTYSVLAPAARYHGKKYAATRSRSVTVTIVGQTADLSVLPRVVQPGTGTKDASTATTSIAARFSPARSGRAVTFEKLVAGTWTKAGTAKESADGSAALRVAAGTTTWRARAEAYSGAASVVSGVSADDWTTQFSDEFTGSTLDATKWSTRNEGQTIDSRTRSVPSPKAASVASGALRLQVLKDTTKAGHFLNGQVSTEKSYLLGPYGVAAARVKFSPWRGQHGGFWMQSPTYAGYPGDVTRSGTEIDVAEFFGKGYPSGGLGSYVYDHRADGSDRKQGQVFANATSLLDPKTTNDSWWSSYHVFSVEWTPSGYTFYVDGRQLWRTTTAVSGRSEFLVLSQLTSDWELDKLDPSHLPTTTYVDWVRTWTRPAP